MSLVHYYPGDSFFHKLDPRAKVVWLICMFLLPFLFNNPLHLGFLLFFVLILWIYVKIPFSELKLFFKALAVVACLSFVFQLIFYPGRQAFVNFPIPNWIPYFGGAFTMTFEGLINGFVVVLRLLTIVLTLPMVTMTTPLEQLVIGFIELGVPYEIAFAATTALNFVPVLQSDARRIVDAQKARAFTALEKGGVISRLRAYVPVIIPLMIGALRKGQQLEIAMESRAFGAFEERTYLVEIKMRAKDYAFAIFMVLATVTCFVLRIWRSFGTLST